MEFQQKKDVILILKVVEDLNRKLVDWRREFHKHPETGWTEYRTSAIIAETLGDLGLEVKIGEEVCNKEYRMGVPDDRILKMHEERALQEGVKGTYIDKMRGGKTGVIGILRGCKPGPVCALRYDIDSNDIIESASVDHRPVAEGFSSSHPGMMHACGHDGHIAIGLGVATVLSLYRDNLRGEIRFIFQPAEEGCRGSNAIVANGWLDDVDYFFSGHIGFKCKTLGEIALTNGFFATSKVNATFIGKAAHAGLNPDEGKNALLGAAHAAIKVLEIPKHFEETVRVNVGQLKAGVARNIIPDRAYMEIETRGESQKTNHKARSELERIINEVATTYELKYEFDVVGEATDLAKKYAMNGLIEKAVDRMGNRIHLVPAMHFGASEDVVYMMNRVYEMGGKAYYVMFGTHLSAGHHQNSFDFDEKVLEIATEFFLHLINLCQDGGRSKK